MSVEGEGCRNCGSIQPVEPAKESEAPTTEQSDKANERDGPPGFAEFMAGMLGGHRCRTQCPAEKSVSEPVGKKVSKPLRNKLVKDCSIKELMDAVQEASTSVVAAVSTGDVMAIYVSGNSITNLGAAHILVKDLTDRVRNH